MFSFNTFIWDELALIVRRDDARLESESLVEEVDSRRR